MFLVFGILSNPRNNCNKHYFFRNSSRENKANCSGVWKGINSLVNIKLSTNNKIILFSGTMTKSVINKTSSLKFNVYFSTIGFVIEDKILTPTVVIKITSQIR